MATPIFVHALARTGSTNIVLHLDERRSVKNQLGMLVLEC